MTSAHPVDLRAAWLLVATFLIAVAGLIYELIAATISSYLLGDSVRQFSLVIGIFLSAMGVGAWVSRFVEAPLRGFIWAQILLGVIGGFLSPFLFFLFGWLGDVSLPLYGALIAIGILSGMEIPLIARVLKEIGATKFRFENVLTVDYIGALVASVSFPLLIIPQVGLMSASLTFGALNLLVAGLSLYLFRQYALRAQVLIWALAMLGTVVALVQSERLVSVTEAQLFEDDVILSEATPYQQITITRFRDRVRLFLNHSIQFDTLDEHRYHEALVHPALGLAPRRARVLILGGGDGMAAREVLRYADVQEVVLVDLDPRVTELFRDHPELAPLNNHAFSDPRVTIHNTDAWRFVDEDQTLYDIVILDLPDPKTIALSRLYTREFYRALAERLSAQGILATQAGSPLFARKAFWSIERTLADVTNPYAPQEALTTRPYNVYVPSFGAWGFVMASPVQPFERNLAVPSGLKFLTPAVWRAAQTFAADTQMLPVEVNTLQTHPLVAYYLEGWDRWFR